MIHGEIKQPFQVAHFPVSCPNFLRQSKQLKNIILQISVPQTKTNNKLIKSVGQTNGRLMVSEKHSGLSGLICVNHK